jgi:hypothetical protein
MRTATIVTCTLLAFGLPAFGQPKPVYENDFEKATVGQLPADFLVLDGGFVIKEENGNKFLELPGSPLDSFSVQFGPAQTEDVSVSARINGTAKGRRFPTFGVGVNGTAGYRLQMSPAKKALELYRDQTLKQSIPYEWKSGNWTQFRLELRKLKEGLWKVEGKAWEEGTPEPKGWMISAEENEAPNAGKASVFASPFSGVRLQFDDLVVKKLTK